MEDKKKFQFKDLNFNDFIEFAEDFKFYGENQKPGLFGMSYALWCIVGTLLFYFATAFICFLCLFIPTYDTKSPFVRTFYFREGTYDSSQISLGKFVYYLLMNIVGSLYVTVVSLRNERASPFQDQHKSYDSFKWTVLVVSPVLFLLSMNINLKSELDFSDQCPQPDIAANYDKVSSLDQSLDILFTFFGTASEERCPYGAIDVLIWNWGVWGTAYFIGLQWTHLDQGPLSHFSIDKEQMKEWPDYFWVIIGCILISLITPVIFCFYKYYVSGVLLFYFLMAFSIAIWFMYFYSKSSDVHWHHYCFGMAVILFCADQDIFICCISGIFNGIMIEGASRYGYDPVFNYDKPKTQIKTKNVKVQNQNLREISKQMGIIYI